ncbi:hypothetical protein NC653_033106 [Populus alba x Populus x berolinensis]|uniref:Uncharacterized protein n=1 Tax=Populus alba x Populus x berolinensis TaxID=444605 RepID=A0AAD6LT32_9ROSI|nr:hypothetical protein NC653_033106 [Populus alba x Populus x berolinensis]
MMHSELVHDASADDLSYTFLTIKLEKDRKVCLVEAIFLDQKASKKQGIKGPPPCSDLFGSLGKIKKLKKVADDMQNLNDMSPESSPTLSQMVISIRLVNHSFAFPPVGFSSSYGETLLFWYGPFPIITIADPELAEQDWARHRKILNNGFSMDKLKFDQFDLHKKWQERLRQGVLKECGMGIPNAEILLTSCKTSECLARLRNRPKSLHWPQFRNVGNENGAGLLLQVFSFSLSPEYKHRPLNNL